MEEHGYLHTDLCYHYVLAFTVFWGLVITQFSEVIKSLSGC